MSSSGGELDFYYQQFQQLRQQAQDLAAGLNEGQFNWRPAAGEWSIAECLGHLVMAGRWDIDALQRAIESGQPRAASGEGQTDYPAVDRFIVAQTEPPAKQKWSAPRYFIPLHGQPVTAILPTLLHEEDQFARLLESSRGLDLTRVKVAIPITRFWKMSLGMAFARVVAHQRRHLEQAQRVRQRMAEQGIGGR